MESIISNKRECLVCKTTYNLHKHHIFYGTGNRKLSEKYGCWCYLCARHHNMSDEGVHFDKSVDKSLKMACQLRWERVNAKETDEETRKAFIRVFGRSWL